MYCLLSPSHSVIQAPFFIPASAFYPTPLVLYYMQHDPSLEGALFAHKQAGVKAPFNILVTCKHF